MGKMFQPLTVKSRKSLLFLCLSVASVVSIAIPNDVEAQVSATVYDLNWPFVAVDPDPLNNPSNSPFGFNGAPLFRPNSATYPALLATSTLVEFEAWFGLSPYASSPSPTDIFQMRIHLEGSNPANPAICETATTTFADLGITEVGTFNKVKMQFVSGNCVLEPNKGYNISKSQISNIAIWGNEGASTYSARWSMNDVLPPEQDYNLEENPQVSTSYETRFLDLDVSQPATPSPTSQLYESIVGTSNPGRFGTANLTMAGGAMGTAVDGKYIESVEINARRLNSPVTVQLDLKNNGITEASAQQVISTTDTASWYTFDFSSNPLFVPDGSQFSLRPIRIGGDDGYPFGLSSGNWNIRINGYEVTATPGEATIVTDYYINQDELNPTVSAFNPTQVSFEIAQRPSSTFNKTGIAINQTIATGTATATISSLSDGVYDLLVRFSNTGCLLESTPCPFPNAYIYTEFSVTGGVVSFDGTSNENYNYLIPPVDVSQYEDCGVLNIGGCITNSFRWLFIPSSDAMSEILSIKDTMANKIPFSYAFDVPVVWQELTNTAYTQDATVDVDILGGTLTLFSKDMVDNTPFVSTFKTLISALLWLMLAFALYRMVLNINSHHHEAI